MVINNTHNLIQYFFFHLGKAKLASVPTGAAVVAGGGGTAAPAASEEKSGKNNIFISYYYTILNFL